MDDPNQENIESSWVMINNIDIAEEATMLNTNVDEINKDDKNHDVTESDIESDGISIISESSHLHESNNEEENFVNDVYQKHDGDDVIKKKSISYHSSPEDALQQKANWMFVESEPVPPEMTSSNQFYLNCLQEPVQELSEHELGSVQSDLESDGISIVSDCESLTDFTDDEKKLCQEILTQETRDNERLEVASKLPASIKKYCNGVLLGTILLATTSIFLGQYFNSVEQMEEELPIYKEEYKNELKENVPDKINEIYEVPTALAYCQERHEADDIFMEHNVNKCLNQIKNHVKRKKDNKVKKEEIKKLEKYLKIKEQYLEEKEQFLIKREYELLRAELKLKQEDLNKNKNEKVKGELNKSVDETLNDCNKTEMGQEPKMNINEKLIKHKEKRHKDAKYQIKHNKSKKYSFKNLHKSKKDKNINAHNENIVYSWKHKSAKFSKHSINKSKKRKNDIKNKKDEKFTNNEHNFMTENYNKNKKTIENLHFSSRENNKSDKLKERKMKSNTNYIILENDTDNQTVSGYWVGKLYKGRNDIRNKKHEGDWYFDRASYRKTKRDKAKWYFDWMMDRELLRYKRSHYI